MPRFFELIGPSPFYGASLYEAKLQETDLTNLIGLIRERIESAIIDDITKLPDYLKRQTPANEKKENITKELKHRLNIWAKLLRRS